MNKKNLAYGMLRWFFFAASLVYLGIFALRSFNLNELRDWISPTVAFSLLLSSILFALTAMFSVSGWYILLRQLEQSRKFMLVARTFCITQIAKYLPGNVGHHIGRVALAKTSLHIPHGVTFVSILQESALACLAALLLSLAGSLLVFSGGHHGLPIPVLQGLGTSLTAILSVALLSGALALFVVNFWRARLSRTNSPIATWLLKAAPSWRTVLLALPSYLAIYVLNGIALFVIAMSITNVAWTDLLILTTAYSLSWTIGFLLPGAPGGLGVREAALAFILGGTFLPETVFLLSVFSRVSTVLADLLIFLFGAMAPGRVQDGPYQL